MAVILRYSTQFGRIQLLGWGNYANIVEITRCLLLKCNPKNLFFSTIPMICGDVLGYYRESVR